MITEADVMAHNASRLLSKEAPFYLGAGAFERLLEVLDADDNLDRIIGFRDGGVLIGDIQSKTVVYANNKIACRIPSSEAVSITLNRINERLDSPRSKLILQTLKHIPDSSAYKPFIAQWATMRSYNSERALREITAPIKERWGGGEESLESSLNQLQVRSLESIATVDCVDIELHLDGLSPEKAVFVKTEVFRTLSHREINQSSGDEKNQLDLLHGSSPPRRRNIKPDELMTNLRYMAENTSREALARPRENGGQATLSI